MIGQTISHYKILEKLGEGGMGVVYKAQDLKLDRLVALKFLPANLITSEEEAARFQQEAKTISSLNHPNVATIYELDEANGQRFLVLEYLPSGTLKSKIKHLQSSGRELSLGQVVDYGLQIAEGLAHAHRHGIIHRDVKTDNMMLTEEGKAKITDFGLAKLRGSAQLTKTGSTVGTAAYMSPEQIQGEEVDHRSDLFSFGIVLYELATGHLPFRGEHEVALSYSIVNEGPVPLKSLRPAIPSSLENVIHRCLEKNTEKRYQSAEEIALDLRRVQQEVSASVAAPGKSSKVPWIVTAAVIIVALFALYVFFPSKPTPLERKSIAVLPFRNLSEEKGSEYFSDGITEDIITQLSKIGELKVISRTSVMRYKNSDKSLRDIGKELDVATILEGSVRRADNQVRIVAQLIDARNDEHLWAETYDKELTQIFAIQSDVAQQIAIALKAKLSPAEKERLEKKPTESLTAYDYYLKGRDYYYRYHKQDNENAIELFNKALEVDPDYALAYAGLGDAYGQRFDKFGFPASWLDSTITVSEKAIVIDPSSAEAYKALGLAYYGKGWYRKALEANHKAVELNPSYWVAVGNIGWMNWEIGEFDEALQWAKKTLEVNPTAPFTYHGVGTVYWGLSDDDKATQWNNRALELQPDFIPARRGLSQMYLSQGKYKDAIEEGRKILSAFPDDFLGLQITGNAELFSGNYAQAQEYYEKAVALYPTARHLDTKTRLGYIYWKTGQQDKAREMFGQNIKIAQGELAQGSEWWEVRYNLAAINAIEGNKAEGYEWLERAIDAGWRFYRLGVRDPLLENLRDDEQFKEMMAQVKAKVDEMRRRVEESERP